MIVKRLQLMLKELLITKEKGFSVIEAVLAASIFGLLVTALSGVFIYGEEATRLSVNRARAVFLAEEGIEVVKNISEEDFVNLIDGTHGLTVVANQWQFFGSLDLTDIFNREVTISTVNPDTKMVVSTITWEQNLQRDGEVVLTTYLTNWREAAAQPDQCDLYCQGQGYDDGTCRESAQQCTLNDETYEAGGNADCTFEPQNTNCCCYTAPPVVTTCTTYCQGLSYTSGTCRTNTQACTKNHETYESGGNLYCTGGPSADTCCCFP